MKKKYIVTVKLPRNPKHDPRNKKDGMCPLNNGCVCTDITGDHHCLLIEAKSMLDAEEIAKVKYGHVTRVEGPW